MHKMTRTSKEPRGTETSFVHYINASQDRIAAFSFTPMLKFLRYVRKYHFLRLRSAWIKSYTSCNSGPTNQSPMLFNTTTKRDLLSNVGASRVGQEQFSCILLDSHNLSTGSSRSNVDHENLVLCELGNLGLLTISSLNTQKTTQKIIVDFDFDVDIRETALESENENRRDDRHGKELDQFEYQHQ
ncbi:hypothetical protein EYC84_007292 [Monilinia fructicola]|uniref:Uncharacterized protein n=1 Tax=Monilinia fructicola TaxID=38448 RepID=A0A5M9KAP6_MONFR|nr:hypothetical protein EYC84_007292 [Monilinia fructicola]